MSYLFLMSVRYPVLHTVLIIPLPASNREAPCFCLRSSYFCGGWTARGGFGVGKEQEEDRVCSPEHEPRYRGLLALLGCTPAGAVLLKPSCGRFTDGAEHIS